MALQKPHISLFDKSYKESNTNIYKLYIELSNNSLKHTILNTENNTYIGIEEYRFTNVYNDYSLVEPVQDIIANNPLYKNDFNSIFQNKMKINSFLIN